MRLTVDSMQPVLSLLRERRIARDARFLGELSRFYENPGLRACYFSAHGGLTVDEVGEALYDAGLVVERPRESEVLDLLDDVLSVASGRVSTRTVQSEENAEARARAAELQRARANRYRAWSCPCGETLIRSSRLSLRLTCGYCDSRVVRTERTVAEIIADVPLHVIQSPDYSPAPPPHVVPF